MQAYGLLVDLDDFGAGYSLLGHLTVLPIDVLIASVYEGSYQTNTQTLPHWSRLRSQGCMPPKVADATAPRWTDICRLVYFSGVATLWAVLNKPLDVENL